MNARHCALNPLTFRKQTKMTSNRFLALVFAVVALTSQAASAASLRIMPLGDSITVGYTDNRSGWDVPYGFGYRSGLYTRLTNAGRNFQFVGGSGEPWNYAYSPAPVGDQIVPPDLRSVNQDANRGYGGAGITTLSNNVVSWLNTDNPDVVLLMIGINSIAQGSTADPTTAKNNLNTLVQKIVTTKPTAQLIVAQITPYSTYTDSLVQYNEYIKNTLVPYWVGQGNHVSTVDQYSNFLTSQGAIDTTLFSNGINHPNATGYDRMAQTWFDGIEAVTTHAPEPSAWAMLIGLGLLMGIRGGWCRLKSKVLPMILLAGVMASANKGSAEDLRIMAVGDSITAGFTNGWKEPFGFGYRGDLYAELTKAGYKVDYVGDSGQPWNYPTPSAPNAPKVVAEGAFDLRTVNQDRHQGYGGKGISFIDQRIVKWLNDDDPNVVLLMIGINNIEGGRKGHPTAAEKELDALVGKIVAAKPDAHLIIAQIIPYANTYTESNKLYNDYIKNTLAPRYAKDGKKVTVVDQYSIFLDGKGQVDKSLYSNGINHPNQEGYNRMAHVWFEGIRKVVPVPNP